MLFVCLRGAEIATTVAELLTKLSADTGDHDRALGKSDSVVKKLGSTFGAVGKAAIGGMAIAATAVAGFAIKGVADFIGFQKQMNEVFTLMPGISQDAMGKMTQQVKDFSREFGVLPQETVPALYQALSSGIPASNVFTFLETSQKAALGGVTDLETAVDSLSSATNAYAATNLSATQASDYLFTAVRLGKTTFAEFGSSMFNVLPTAASLGIGLDQVSAAVATLTVQGVPTSVVMTQMRQAFVEASKGGTELDKAIKKLHGESFAELIAGGQDIGTVFQGLRSKMGDQAFKDLFGSVEALNFALGITGENADLFSGNLDQMKGSAGATEKAFGTMNKGIGQSMERLKAFGATLLLDIGEKLAPFVEGAVSWLLEIAPKIGAGIKGIFDYFSSPEVSSTLSKVAGLIGQGLGQAFTFLSGAVTAAWPFVQSVFAFLSSPELAAVVRSLTDAIGTGLGNAWSFLGGVLAVVWPVVQAAFSYLTSPEFTSTIVTLGGALMNVLGAAMQFIGDHAGALAIVIGVVLIPAFVAWAIAAGAAAIATVAAAAPVIAAVAAIGLAAAALKLAWDNNFLGIQQIVEGTGQVIGTVFGAILEFFKPLGDAIGTFFSAISNGEDVLAAFGDLIGTIGGLLGDLASQIWDWARTTASDALVKAAEIGGAILDGIGSGLKGIGDWAGGLAQNIWNWIVQTASDALVKAAEIGGSILDGIGDGLKKAGDWAGGLAQNIWNWIRTTASDALTKAAEIGGKIIDGIGDGIGQWLGNLAGAAVWIWNWITQTAGDALGKAAEIGGKIVDGIGDGIKNFWNGVVSFLGGLIIGLPAAVAGAALQAGGAIAGDIVKGITGYKPDADLKAWANGLIDDPFQGAGPSGPGLPAPVDLSKLYDHEKIGELWRKINGANDQGGKDLAAGAKGAMSSFNSAISGGISTATSTAKQGTAAIVAVFRESFSASRFLGFGVTAMGGLANGIIAGGMAAIGATRNMSAAIVGSVRAAMNYGMFYSLGLNLGAGLSAGIAASGAQAVAQAREVANAVAATMRAALAIHSKSQVAEEIGEYVVEGLVSGLNKMAAAPLQATEKIISGLIGVAKRVVTKGTSELVESLGKMIGVVGDAVGMLGDLGDKDFMLPGKKLVDGFFKAVDWIVGNTNHLLGKYEKSFTEARGKLAGFASDIVGAFGDAVGILGELGEKDYALPTRKLLDGFFGAVDVFLGKTQHLLGKYETQLTEVRAQLAEFAGRIVSGLGEAVDPLRDLGGDEGFVAPTAESLNQFFFGVDEFLKRAKLLIDGWTGLWDEVRADLAGFMGSVVDDLGSAVGTLKDIASDEFVIPTAGALKDFFYGVDQFLKRADLLILGWTGLWNETRVELAGFIGSVVSDLGNAVDTLKDLANKDFAVPTEAVLDNFFYATDEFLKRADLLILGWTGLWDKTRADLAGFIGSVVDGIGKGADDLQKLASKDFAVPPIDTLNNFFYVVDEFLKRADLLVLGWKGLWDQTRVDLANFIGGVVDGLGKAADDLQKLASKDFVLPTIETISHFIWKLDEFLKSALPLIMGWTGIWDKDRADLAGFMGGVVDGIGKAADDLQKLASKDFALPAIDTIKDFIWKVDEFLKEAFPLVMGWGGQWKTEDFDRVAEAGFIGSVVDSIGKAIAPLVNLVKFVPVPTENIGAFFSALDDFLAVFTARASQWRDKATEDTKILAGHVGSIVADIGKAIDPLVKLMKFGEGGTALGPSITAGGVTLGMGVANPLTANIDAFFGHLDHFISEFARRAKDWSGKATEESAKLAGYIGTVMDNINKAIDPILKMKDAQAITEGQIEGALANVWLALHHFNMVMKGGSEGEAFQGAWMERAQEFAKGIGSIFSELKTALGVMADASKAGGGGGFGTLLSEMKDAWLGVFGPWDREGSLLNVLFGDAGMFDWLDAKIPVQVAFSAGVWEEALDHMKMQISSKLREIGDALYLDGMYIGQKIAQGIADAVGSGSSGPGGQATPYVPPMFGGGGESVGSGGQSTHTVINNPVYIEGQRIEDPDLHRMLVRTRNHKSLRSGHQLVLGGAR